MTASPNRLNGHALNIDAPDLTLDPPQTPPPGSLNDVAVGNAPVFTPSELEQLAWRRFNPLSTLSALTLSAALDSFATGLPAQAARLWQEIVFRDETLASVKAKREEAVALRDWTVVPLDDSPAAQDQAAALSNFYRQFAVGREQQPAVLVVGDRRGVDVAGDADEQPAQGTRGIDGEGAEVSFHLREWVARFRWRGRWPRRCRKSWRARPPNGCWR